MLAAPPDVERSLPVVKCPECGVRLAAVSVVESVDHPAGVKFLCPITECSGIECLVIVL